jgi:hypothetical protein
MHDKKQQKTKKDAPQPFFLFGDGSKKNSGK